MTIFLEWCVVLFTFRLERRKEGVCGRRESKQDLFQELGKQVLVEFYGSDEDMILSNTF